MGWAHEQRLAADDDLSYLREFEHITLARVLLNTMWTHTKSIYNKLAVNNRRAAVRRAEELDLLPRTQRQ